MNLIITPAVRALRRQYPDTDVRTLYLDYHEVRTALLEHRVDAVVARLPFPTDQLSHGGTMTNARVTELIAFTIDCSDATRLARFYADLTDGEVTGDYPEYGVAQTTTLGVTLNFQGVKDYAPPAWPGQEHPQQYHLDFRVPDLEKATEYAIGLGATQAEEQPNEKLWRVMIDPDGHPFCLCPPRD
jgi:hypothetical protein